MADNPRAAVLLAKYGFDLDHSLVYSPPPISAPLHPILHTPNASAPPPCRIRRVQKSVRMRVHWNCHSCSTGFGSDRTCRRCGHRRCQMCTRSPSKTIREVLGEANLLRQREPDESAWRQAEDGRSWVMGRNGSQLPQEGQERDALPDSAIVNVASLAISDVEEKDVHQTDNSRDVDLLHARSWIPEYPPDERALDRAFGYMNRYGPTSDLKPMETSTTPRFSPPNYNQPFKPDTHHIHSTLKSSERTRKGSQTSYSDLLRHEDTDLIPRRDSANCLSSCNNTAQDDQSRQHNLDVRDATQMARMNRTA